MKNLNKFIEIGAIDNHKDNKRYHLTSVYISLEKNFEDDDENDPSYKNDYEEDKYLSLISYDLKNEKEIIFFLNNEKFKENFGGDFLGREEFDFPNPIVFTIHAHDTEKLDSNSDFHTYYAINLSANKIIFSSKINKYCLEMKKKNGDENFIFSEKGKNSGSYQIFHKNNI